LLVGYADDDFGEKDAGVDESPDQNVLAGHAKGKGEDEADPCGERVAHHVDVDLAADARDALEGQAQDAQHRKQNPPRIREAQTIRLEGGEVLGDGVHDY